MRSSFKKATLLSFGTLMVTLPVLTSVACTKNNSFSEVQAIKLARTELYERTRNTIVSKLRASELQRLIDDEVNIIHRTVDEQVGIDYADKNEDELLSTINTYGSLIQYSLSETKTGREGKKFELLARISKGNSSPIDFPIMIQSLDYVEWTNSGSTTDVTTAVTLVKEAISRALGDNTNFRSMMPQRVFSVGGIGTEIPDADYPHEKTQIRWDEDDNLENDLYFDAEGTVVKYNGKLAELEERTRINFEMPELPEGVFAVYTIHDNFAYPLMSATTTFPAEENEVIYPNEVNVDATGMRYSVAVEIGKRGSITDKSIEFDIETSDFYTRKENIANGRIRNVWTFLNRNSYRYPDVPNPTRKTETSDSFNYNSGQNSLLKPELWFYYNGTIDIREYGLNPWAENNYLHSTVAGFPRPPDMEIGFPEGVKVQVTFRKEQTGRTGAVYELVFEITAPHGTTDRRVYFYFRTKDYSA